MEHEKELIEAVLTWYAIEMRMLNAAEDFNLFEALTNAANADGELCKAVEQYLNLESHVDSDLSDDKD